MQKEKVRITTLTREQKEELLDAILAGKAPGVMRCPMIVDMLMRDLRGARLPNESWLHYFINEKLGFHGNPRLWQMLGSFVGCALIICICFGTFAVIKFMG